jgi:hypothetical protein
LLPDFVTSRADWFGYVGALTPLLAERFGAELLEKLGSFILATDQWLSNT